MGYVIQKRSIKRSPAYKIIYDTGGVAMPQGTRYFFSEYDSFKLPTLSNKPGYIFRGWQKLDGTPVTEHKLGTKGNITYKVKWETIRYRINYLLDGGYWENSALVPTSFTVEDEVKLIYPKKNGFTTIGLFRGEEKVEKIPRGTIGDVDLSARYEVRRLPVSTDNSVADRGNWVTLKDKLLEEFFQRNGCDYAKYKKELTEQTVFTIDEDKNYIIDITNIVPWKVYKNDKFPVTENGRYEFSFKNVDICRNNVQFVKYNLSSKKWELLNEGDQVTSVDIEIGEAYIEFEKIEPFLNIAGLYNESAITLNIKREFIPWEELFNRQYLIFNERNEVVCNQNFSETKAPEVSGNPVSKYFNGSLIISNDAKLSYRSFFSLTALGSVQLPDGITEIPPNCFQSSPHVKVEIPRTVNKIYEYAFDGNFDGDYKIPNSVTYIGTNAFKRVTTIYYSGTATGSPWGALKVLPNPDET